jgi:hypothetical protein
MQVALRALDGVLKELPLAGYVWPKLSAEAALAWTAVRPIPLPDDYFGSPVAWRLVDGKKVPLTAGAARALDADSRSQQRRRHADALLYRPRQHALPVAGT